MEDGLGFKFWAGVAGVIIAAGIGMLILFLIINRTWYAWGFFGTFVVIGGLLLLIAWFYDKRQQRQYEEVE
jgi:uncharacterized membrane protein HdeD (DUF308 family)